jgi:putative SOS response-associated peptidase YedK
MCGRYVLYGPKSRLIEGFSIKELPAFRPRYNVAPNSEILIVRKRDGKRVAEMMRWGLRNGKVINVRDDSVDKPWAKSLLAKSRCLIPCNGFYEWRKVGKLKQPYFIHPKVEGEIWAFAGVMAFWEDAGAAMFTTSSNSQLEPIHNRMPVLLQRSDYETWLDPGNQDVDSLRTLLKPYPEELMLVRPVGAAVSNPKNESERLIAEIPNPA